MRGRWRGIYGWYYATYAFHRIGGTSWEKWGPAIETTLATLQSKKGHASGSWDTGPLNARSGRIYTTALGALTLEAYYRHRTGDKKKATAGR